MNPSASAPFKSAGLLVFLATGIIGWRLAAPSVPVEKGEPTTTASVTKHAPRPARPSRSGAADAADWRMGAVRSATNLETRMLATISLAESLSPGEFAAWMDGGWFDLRGGPELEIFSKILLDRWRQEDPEGLIAWSLKNQNDKADDLMKEWAMHEPQRLLAYFKSHRDDVQELWGLAVIANKSPDLALQRLREMSDAGIASDSVRSARDLIRDLAKKSPAGLEKMLGSLQPAMKLWAEGALSEQRMDASFDDEIDHLRGREDGWKIFSSYFNDSKDLGRKLLGRLADLPPEWRSGLASYSWRTIQKIDAQQWWDADLEGAGFSASQAKNLRIQSLQLMAGDDPETTFERMGELDLSPDERKETLDRIFTFANDPEKARELIAKLATQEERDAATRLLDREPEVLDEVRTPEDLFAKLATGKSVNSAYLSQVEGWGPEQVAALAGGFKALPDEQKRKLSQVVIGSLENNDVPPVLRDEAVRYFAENPTALNAGSEWGSEGAGAQISQYAVGLSNKDPVAAGQWVEALPAGVAKAWIQKNLISNWRQYDPKAAAAWEKSLPAGEREAIGKLGN